MANHYYYDNSGQKQGPVSGRDIKQLALSGVITPHTLVEMDNGPTVTASRIAGLEFPKTAVPPPAAVAAPKVPKPVLRREPETYGVAVQPQPPAPAAPLFKYVDAEGRKQAALTFLQLQALAQKGIITPKTIIENAAGQTALAENVKGLVFQQETAINKNNPLSAAPAPVPVSVPRATAAPKSKEDEVSLFWKNNAGWIAVLIGLVLMGMGYLQSLHQPDVKRNSANAAPKKANRDEELQKTNRDKELQDAYRQLVTTQAVGSQGQLTTYRTYAGVSTTESVRRLLGEPDDVSMSDSGTGHSESWTYKSEQGEWLRLSFQTFPDGKLYLDRKSLY